MRLTPHEADYIRQTARAVFGKQCRVILFGSRVDDSARGGDIDLLIDCQIPITNRVKKSADLAARLQLGLGEQPFDILVLDPDMPHQRIHDAALQHGIQL